MVKCIVVIIIAVQHCAASVDLYVRHRVRNHRQSPAVQRHIVAIRGRRLIKARAVRPVDRQVGHVAATAADDCSMLTAAAAALVTEVRTRDNLLPAAGAAATVANPHGSGTQAHGHGPGRGWTLAGPCRGSRNITRRWLLVARSSAYSITHRSP